MASKSLDDVLEFYGKTCQFRGCVDVPVKSFGKQMDVVLWSCPKCGKERLLFYELQLELDYDKWSRKLLRRYLQCKVFRAFCIMYKRFDRLGYVIGYAKQSNEIRNVLNEWYETQNYAVPNYMTAYMFKNQLPSKKAHEKMSRLLSKNGNALLYNRPFVLPGVEGAFEPAIPDPLKHRSKIRQYPLRQHFYAFNDLQLNHFIRNFESEENYEMATFFQQHIASDGVVLRFVVAFVIGCNGGKRFVYHAAGSTGFKCFKRKSIGIKIRPL